MSLARALRTPLLVGSLLGLLVVPAGSRSSAEPALEATDAASRIECSVVASKVLGRKVRFCAVLPAAYDAQPARRFPVLYWLHGLGQNEQSFVSAGGSTVLDDLRSRGTVGNFIVVTPDGGRSFYLNSRDGHNRYEDFFIREFLPAMERRYRIQAGRSTRGVSGVSMGGFGALHFGLKYPELFGSASAHSAAVMQEPPAVMTTGARLGFFEEIFGRPVDRAYWERESLFTLASRAPAAQKWKIYFDCGSEDDFGFDEGNRALDHTLTADGIAHEFHLYPGGHGWNYFAKHLPASLEVHWKVFLKGEQG